MIGAFAKHLQSIPHRFHKLKYMTNKTGRSFIERLKNGLMAVTAVFTLAYICTALASGKQLPSNGNGNGNDNKDNLEANPRGEESNELKNKIAARWKIASLDSNIIPSYFRESQENIINRPDQLNKAFDVLCKSGRALRVLQLGDSHVAGGSYPKAVETTLESAWGKAVNDSTTGIEYAYMARNGATTKRFATENWMKQVEKYNPDLIILSFGTNECHGMGYREEVHAAQLEDFFTMLKEVCPSAVIMLTTPPGDYLTTRRVRYVRRGKGRKARRVYSSYSRVNPMSVRCAAELEEFGEEHNLPVWDLNTIAGGELAQKNWTSANLMRPDRIHFTPEGYKMHGKLLATAILKAYNGYINKATNHFVKQ